MPEKYEGETCEGCVDFYGGQLRCRAKPSVEGGGFAIAYHSEPICDHFSPSLECRLVRAWERWVGRGDE